MKGTGAMSTGSSVSMGGRASGGVTAGGGAGLSLSPEARFGGPASSFSSRGLASYKEALSSSININHGREAKPAFARTANLVPKTSIIDMSRPFSKGRVTSVPRESKASIASRAFEASKTFFKSNKDMTKYSGIASPISKRGAEPERKSALKVDAFKNTVILWERPRIERVTSVSRVSGLPTVKSGAREIATPRPSEIQKPKTVFQHVEARIKVSPKSETARSFHLDMKQAERTVRAMTAVGFTQPKAYEVVTQTLAKKYEGKPGVELLPKTATASEITTEPQVIVQTQVLSEVHTKLGVENPQIENEEGKKPLKKDEKKGIKFYFVAHQEAIKNRIEGAISAARQLLQNQDKVTGKDVAYIMSRQAVGKYESEVAMGVRSDGTHKEFLEKLEKMGEIEDVHEMEIKIGSAAIEHKPVKLSFSSEGDQVGHEGAMKVYEGPLDGKRAYFKDNGHRFGRFKDGKENDQVWFVPDSNSLPIPA